jgi:hypothetical protein
MRVLHVFSHGKSRGTFTEPQRDTSGEKQNLATVADRAAAL